MAGNTFGKIFKLTTFGESHGKSIGGIIDGCPAGVSIDLNNLQYEMNRRKPGQSKIVTQRKESDKVEFLSGIFEGITTGTPIGFVIHNSNQKSEDYEHIKNIYRPSHADYVYNKKYGLRDHRGGGRSSARETAARVVAGSIAKQFMSEVQFYAFVSAVGELKLENPHLITDFSHIESNSVRCPDPKMANKMEKLINQIRMDGDSVGGVISCVIKNVPIGLGEPVFDKLHAELGKAMLSINAVKGFEYGSGFEGASWLGSKHNDPFNKDGSTKTNYSGGIQGGISNGMDIYFNVAFKPVSTIMKDQKTIDEFGNEATIHGKGRHDPCVLPRAVPIVEAMASLVIADNFLQAQTNSIIEDSNKI